MGRAGVAQRSGTEPLRSQPSEVAARADGGSAYSDGRPLQLRPASAGSAESYRGGMAGDGSSSLGSTAGAGPSKSESCSGDSGSVGVPFVVSYSYVNRRSPPLPRPPGASSSQAPDRNFSSD